VAVPSDITGLWGWWEADTNGGLADGATIQTWPDQSGNSRDLAQATSGNRPTVQTNELNSLPIIRFDASAASYFTVPNMSALTAGTVFLLVKIDADPPPGDLQSGLWNMGSTDGDHHFPYTDGNVYDGWGSTVRKSTGNPTLSISSAFRLYCVSSSSGDWTSWFDGTQHFTTATNTVSFPATPTFGRSFSTNWYLDGDVAELFIFDSALSTGDRQLMEAYIIDKWFTVQWPPPGSEDSPARLQVAHSGLVF
jgi:hypothetical protein